MSSNEAKISRNNSHKKSKTQKFDFEPKSNHITIKATDTESNSSQTKKNNRHSLMYGNENINNIAINPFRSYNFNPEVKILINETQKSQEPLPKFSRANKKKTIKLSPSKIKKVFDSLNNNKELNSNKSKSSQKWDKYLFPKKNKNYINFVDRNKIRNIKLNSLNIFKQYFDDNLITKKKDNLKSGLLSSMNKHGK